jgi:AbrB family looped-hinge helix DNA binding protein
MKVTIKGQVTIPQALRIKYGIAPHAEVRFIEKEEGILLVREKPEDGIFSSAANTADTNMSTEEILALTRGKD